MSWINLQRLYNRIKLNLFYCQCKKFIQDWEWNNETKWVLSLGIHMLTWNSNPFFIFFHIYLLNLIFQLAVPTSPFPFFYLDVCWLDMCLTSKAPLLNLNLWHLTVLRSWGQVSVLFPFACIYILVTKLLLCMPCLMFMLKLSMWQ